MAPQKEIALNYGVCLLGPNLVILTWMDDALWLGQPRCRHTDTRTDTQTDRQMHETTIPKGQNWPRVKVEQNNKARQNPEHVTRAK